MKQASLVFNGRHELAEGPVWFEGALWWVNITAGELHRLDLIGGGHTFVSINQQLGAAAPVLGHRGSKWALAARDGFFLLDWESGALELIASPPEKDPVCRFNDGKCDPEGRFVAGTLHLGGATEATHLFSLDGSSTRLLLDRINLSNGLAWSADGKTLYYIDTPTRRVDVLDYDPSTGAVANRRTLRNFRQADGWPDGMTIDSEGNLWVAFWEGSAVHAFRSSTGEHVTSIGLPCSRVTSCTFGGANLDTLFITTAWQGASENERENQPLAGSIFSARTGTTGFPVNGFRAK